MPASMCTSMALVASSRIKIGVDEQRAGNGDALALPPRACSPVRRPPVVALGQIHDELVALAALAALWTSSKVASGRP